MGIKATDQNTWQTISSLTDLSHLCNTIGIWKRWIELEKSTDGYPWEIVLAFCKGFCSSVRYWRKKRTLLNHPKTQSGIKYWIFIIKQSIKPKCLYIDSGTQNNREHFLLKVFQLHKKNSEFVHYGDSFTSSPSQESVQGESVGVSVAQRYQTGRRIAGYKVEQHEGCLSTSEISPSLHILSGVPCVHSSYSQYCT